MSIRLTGRVVCVVALIATNNAWSHGTEIEALRAAIDQLRTDYETTIADLEQRLVVAERNASQAVATTDTKTNPPMAAPATSRGSASGSAFNPAIGVIFEGQAWNYAGNPRDGVQGFPFGGEAGPIDEGLAIAETEINISGNVDDKFTAWLTVPVVIEDGEAGIEIEEAWLETTALPAGLSARFGRFFSGIGYLNNKHAHSWDFADQPLPYQAFLGNQFLDDGLQLRWIAPTDIFVEAGAELFRGSRFPAAGSVDSGIGAKSLFVNFGADAGMNSSWLAGLSHLQAQSLDRASGDEDSPLFFSGDTDTTIAQFVWKWAPNGNWKQRNLVVQTEWLWRSESGFYTLPGGSPLAYRGDQDGWYLQATYQPIPRWRYGARIDTLSMDNLAGFFSGSSLASPMDDPMRYSLMADWSNSEFSRLRLQYTRDETGASHQNQWGLQYIFSIGAHGGHSF